MFCFKLSWCIFVKIKVDIFIILKFLRPFETVWCESHTLRIVFFVFVLGLRNLNPNDGVHTIGAALENERIAMC